MVLPLNNSVMVIMFLHIGEASPGIKMAKFQQKVTATSLFKFVPLATRFGYGWLAITQRQSVYIADFISNLDTATEAKPPNGMKIPGYSVLYLGSASNYFFIFNKEFNYHLQCISNMTLNPNQIPINKWSQNVWWSTANTSRGTF